MYAYDLPEEEMEELKKVLAAFFVERIRKRIGELWQERGYTEETMPQWGNDENQ
ncbi:MAG: hypothetical protein ABIQ93_04915 [Saprospiraceae bacterium]